MGLGNLMGPLLEIVLDPLFLLWSRQNGFG